MLCSTRVLPALIRPRFYCAPCSIFNTRSFLIHLQIITLRCKTIFTSNCRLISKTVPTAKFVSSSLFKAGDYRQLSSQLRWFSDNSNNQSTMSDNRFAADYDKLGRASCKKCKQKLNKGELRIAKITANFFHEGEGVMKQYHHPKCMFETFVRARSTTKIIEGPDDLEGFVELKDEDKDALKALIAGEQSDCPYLSMNIHRLLL